MNFPSYYHDPNFGLATKAKTFKGVGPRIQLRNHICTPKNARKCVKN